MVNEPDACHGPCQQDTTRCPHPQACHMPEEPDFYGREQWLDILEGAIAVAVLTGSAILAGVLISRWLV